MRKDKEKPIIKRVVHYGITLLFLTVLLLMFANCRKVEMCITYFLIALLIFSSFLALGTSTRHSLILNLYLPIHFLLNLFTSISRILYK